MGASIRGWFSYRAWHRSNLASDRVFDATSSGVARLASRPISAESRWHAGRKGSSRFPRTYGTPPIVRYILRARTRVAAVRSSPEWRHTRHPPNQIDAPRNSAPHAPKTKHARNQAGTNAADAAADRGGQNLGGARKGAGRKPRGRPSMPHVTRPKVDPRFPVQVTVRADVRAPVASVATRVRSAPTRHRAGVGRSLPGDSLLDPAGPRSLHRRRRRGAPCPWWRARAGDSIGACRQPRPGTQGEGRRRSVPRPITDDAATDADEHGLRAAQLPEAPPRPRVYRSAELGATFFRMAGHPDGHECGAGDGQARHLDGVYRLAARGRAVAGRRTPGRDAATADLESADVEASGPAGETSPERRRLSVHPFEERRSIPEDVTNDERTGLGRDGSYCGTPASGQGPSRSEGRRQRGSRSSDQSTPKQLHCAMLRPFDRPW